MYIWFFLEGWLVLLGFFFKSCLVGIDMVFWGDVGGLMRLVGGFLVGVLGGGVYL